MEKNRAIKFRGKSIDKSIKTGDWLYGGIVFDNDRYWIDIPYYGNIIADKDTIGQFTGLIDKNGKEIYEGDIVKVKYKGKEDIGKIIYEYNGFTIDVMNMKRPYGRVPLIERFTEVIGNIYDNPELLEV